MESKTFDDFAVGIVFGLEKNRACQELLLSDKARPSLIGSSS